MKLRKFTLPLLLGFVFFIGCNNDDDTPTAIPDRDRGVVYEEDLAEIEAFLNSHFYNYEDFDFTDPYSPANDSFQIEFTPLSEDPSKTPLIDMVDFKIVTDRNIDYKLYFLNVREGQGNLVHFCDQAFVTYEGSLTTGYVFDSAVSPSGFNLITAGSEVGVVKGFQQGIIEFKTSTGFTDNGNGTVSYHNHGIGAVFIPSGLGYFSQPLVGVDSYTPLIFKFSLYERVIKDHDNDNIPSFLEDLNENGDVYDDDTDGDFGPNFIDNDDDGDGYFTKDEVELMSYDEDDTMTPFMSEEEAQSYFDNNALANEIFDSIDDNNDGTFTLNTVIITDSNGDGTPDYLDKNTTPE
ncbi:FKBP-type peptidyl-prolyl cis-trans isomerase [Hanstruepera ponticola]|uniref:FKBP-type peptidyl-prolyl cis-trans isomerase n=1 Tax=Hanstruepera ponticola TaxID=2042995 RepID=UPI00177E0A9D|nr:hypothetical protein [Hanstruepera ponticola]